MFKIKFVQNDLRHVISDPTVAVVPFGTTLHDAKSILTKVFEAQNPTTKEHQVVGIEWEEVLIKDDLTLEAVVLIKELVQNK